MNARVDPPAEVRTTCPYCGVGCGIVARAGQEGVEIAGDPAHPATFRQLCSKGSALGETLGLEGRLLYPMLRDASGAMHRVSWDEALARTADGFRNIIRQHGPDSAAFYLSGQLLTEDYYAANKLMKGFIGSGNVYTNSRLCMASSVAGHRRAFGSDTVPGNYEDLDEADLIVLVGSNAAWCHPILFQRIVKNRERGAKVVVIDPRRTATAEEADLFLPIAPGMDTALFSGLLVYLADHRALDRAFIESHTAGFDAALSRAREIAPDIAAVSRAAKLAEEDIVKFFALFWAKEKSVTCYSQGVNQSAQGTDKVNAINHRPLATGRNRKAGGGAVFVDRSAERDGRPRGGRPRQPARRAYVFFAPGSRSRPALLERTKNRRARRPESRADVRGDRARRGEGALDHGDESGRIAPACGRGAGRAQGTRASRHFRECRFERHAERRRARFVAGRRLGREGRHGDEFRAPHFAPARIPAAAGRSEARLVDRLAGGGEDGFCRSLFVSNGSGRVSRARGAFRFRE